MQRLRGALWVLVLALCGSTHAAEKPNVIVILADDLGYGDLSVHGGKTVPTPQIDSIAQNGVRCTNGYVSCPYCSPTRAGLMTGRYQNRFGHEFNGDADLKKFGTPASEVFFARRMKDVGYATAAIGKWHLGANPGQLPTERGFDEFYGTANNTAFFHPELIDSREGLKAKKIKDKEFYTTTAFAARASDFIRQNKDKPFFIYLPFNAVHAPNQAPEKYLERFAEITDMRRQAYAAMLAAFDDAVGSVLGTVRELNLEERTLIFFLSDNGGTRDGTNKPFYGWKGSVYEGGIRVPFFVQWKGRLEAGKVYEQPVIALDILPTALAAAGAEIKPEWKLDGVNLLPYFEGKVTTPPHETLYWRFGPQWAIRQGDWKLLVGRDYSSSQKDVWSPYAKVLGVKLINLAEDKSERKDVAAEHPEKVAALEAAWKAWNAELMDPLWIPSPDAKPDDEEK